jgi:uncharacterized protein (DUF1778 family)
MAESPVPTTFRLLPKERAILEAVAHASGRSLSAYVRDAALAAARGYIAREGIEKVLELDRAYLEDKARTSNMIADHKEALLEATSELPSDDPAAGHRN